MKRRITTLAAAIVVVTTMVAVPAQADHRLGRQCERDFERQSRQLQCCENRADNDREERHCKRFVRNH